MTNQLSPALVNMCLGFAAFMKLQQVRKVIHIDLKILQRRTLGFYFEVRITAMLEYWIIIKNHFKEI
jgi:hypothetical protein